MSADVHEVIKNTICDEAMLCGFNIIHLDNHYALFVNHYIMECIWIWRTR